MDQRRRDLCGRRHVCLLTMKKERKEMRKKLSVITGGSSGLGLAAARCLASETSVLLCARGDTPVLFTLMLELALSRKEANKSEQ